MKASDLTENQIICGGDVKKGLTSDTDSSVSRKALPKEEERGKMTKKKKKQKKLL